MNPAIRKALATLDRHVHHFDLDRDGLGIRAMDVAAEAMLATMDAETDADGNPWAPLSEAYAEQKAVIAPGAPMAVLHGILKQLDQLQGERSVTPLEATMVFGVDGQAKQEAIWFSEGNANQPARPFWGLTAEAIRKTDEMFADHLGRL